MIHQLQCANTLSTLDHLEMVVLIMEIAISCQTINLLAEMLQNTNVCGILKYQLEELAFVLTILKLFA